MQAHESPLKVAGTFDLGIDDDEGENYEETDQKVGQLEGNDCEQGTRRPTRLSSSKPDIASVEQYWSSDMPDPDTYPSSSSLPSSPLPHIFTSSPTSFPSWPAHYSSTPPDADLEGDDAGEKFEMLPPPLSQAQQYEEDSWVSEDADPHHCNGQSGIVEARMPLTDDQDEDHLEDDTSSIAGDASFARFQEMPNASPAAPSLAGKSASAAGENIYAQKAPNLSPIQTPHEDLLTTVGSAPWQAKNASLASDDVDDGQPKDGHGSSPHGGALDTAPVFVPLHQESARLNDVGFMENDIPTSRGAVEEARFVGIDETEVRTFT